jgi:hypothetical protein
MALTNLPMLVLADSADLTNVSSVPQYVQLISTCASGSAQQHDCAIMHGQCCTAFAEPQANVSTLETAML